MAPIGAVQRRWGLAAAAATVVVAALVGWRILGGGRSPPAPVVREPPTVRAVSPPSPPEPGLPDYVPAGNLGFRALLAGPEIALLGKLELRERGFVLRTPSLSR